MALASLQRMATLLKLLLCGVAAASFGAVAAENDDGFIWIDANTKIRVKPIGSASAAAGGTVRKEEPKEDKKPEKRKK